MKGNSSNFKLALWLSIGQFCTYTITFVSTIILVRYFDKMEYGTYKQILYVYTSLQTLFAMGLPSAFAYFIPRLNKNQQKQLVNKLTQLFLLFGFIFSAVLYFSADFIANLLRNPELSVGIRLFAPLPLFTLPTMGVEGIYTALRRTKDIAVYHIFSKLIMLLCIILPVVVWNMGYREAIIGWGTASFLTFIVAMYMKSQPYFKIDTEIIPNMYRRVFSYSLPLTGAFIAGFFANSADQFFISRYYGTTAFAEFSNGSLSIPIVGVIAVSVKNVLLPIFSKADATHSLDEAIKSYNNAVAKTATIVLPMLLFCFFFAADIMVALYGNQYLASKDYFRMYIIRDFLQVIPYFAVLMALGYSKIYMDMHVVGAFAIWTLDFILIYLGGEGTSIVLITSLFHVSCSFVAFVYLYKKTHISLLPYHIIRYFIRIIIHCSLCLGVLICIRQIFLPVMNVFVSLAFCGSIFYILIVSSGYFLKVNYLESIQLLIKLKYDKR